MMVFYGYSVMKNPRVWGDQGRRAVKAEHFEEYCRQNGLFFPEGRLRGGGDRCTGCTHHAGCPAVRSAVSLRSGLRVLSAGQMVPRNEGFSWPWPHVQSEKKRIKELRREQESQEKAEQDSDKK